ncbi:antibiotic biosynthesis monooxygenase family protein [Marinomonas ostreistagni]|uniref:antibiotic biosynthesis monooxygenase family protein n=1 Tax=Marinomonas ostreistagni TaxID=359209 RepID=UPI00194DB803|nr:antibiotic biosynthesis monooxygenase [Marinomonas ostreistagni]MBM6551802.1 antibiotic biosynthesis monooxygenase [Marinomonas ostreistagni]
MIRVIYEWYVVPENLEAFSEAWQQTTTLVREVYQGAHGSCLLKDSKDAHTVLTIARWNSEDDWRTFWSSENPPEVTQMSKLARLKDIKIYEEIGHFKA